MVMTYTRQRPLLPALPQSMLALLGQLLVLPSRVPDTSTGSISKDMMRRTNERTASTSGLQKFLQRADARGQGGVPGAASMHQVSYGGLRTYLHACMPLDCPERLRGPAGLGRRGEHAALHSLAHVGMATCLGTPSVHVGVAASLGATDLARAPGAVLPLLKSHAVCLSCAWVAWYGRASTQPPTHALT